MAWWNNGSSLANSLVAYWKLDEASGSRADSVGANTLTDNNTVTSNTGKVNALAAEFLAANSENLSIADNVALSMADIQMFFGGWVYLTDKSALRMAFSKNDSGSNQRAYFIEYDNATDRILAGFNATGSGTSTTVASSKLGSPALNTWYFVLAWHDSVANTINISVNAREPDSASYTTGIFDNTAAFRIGSSASSGAANNFWSGRIGPVFVGKNYIPTAQDRIDMLKEAPSEALASWWLANSQVSASNVKEHVELPDIGQVYAGGAIADGQPWSVAFKSYSYLASANQLHYAFDSQDGQFVAGISNSSSYGFYNGTAWTNAAIFATAAEQIWFFVSDGSTIQAYLNNVAVGSASASSIGLDVTGTTRWGSAYDNSGAFWNNPILYGAVYDIALTSDDRLGLYQAMQQLNTGSTIFTASGSFVPATGVTIVTAQVWGGGGGGADGTTTQQSPGGGGGGGGYARGDVNVTPGNSYTATVAAVSGSTGAASTFTGDSGQTVVGGGGAVGTTTGNGAGGAGSGTAATTTFSGGHGGTRGGSSSGLGGAGGGAAAGTINNGAVGNNGPVGSSTGAAGGTGGNGGASGGSGGLGSSGGNGGSGGAPGGGGGGCGGGSINRSGGNGGRGQVNITWVYPTPPVEVAPSDANAVGATAAPTTVKGSVAPATSTDDAIGTTVAPTTIKGSVALTPGAASGVGTTSGEVVQGSAALSPNTAAARSDVVGPDVAVGANPIEPAPAEAGSDVQGPTVEKGSAVASPAPSTVTARTVGGNVQGSGATLVPDPASETGTTVGPTIVKGSVSPTTSPAQAVAGQVNPTVIKGGMVLSPTAAGAVGSAAAPTTVKGSAVLTGIAWVGSETSGAAAVGGAVGIVIEPDPAEAVGDVHGPTQAVVGLYDTVDKRIFAGVFKGMH